MQASQARLILKDVYSSWERGDLLTTLSYFAGCLVFVVHASPGAPSLIGVGFGRDRFGRRLELFLEQFEVEKFELLSMRADRDGFCSNAAYKYIHRDSGLDMEGRMRHKWRFVGDEIVSFRAFHGHATPPRVL